MADYIINVGGAIVDFIDQRNGMSPLMYAILNNDLEMVMLMLNNNASIDLCDFKCVTPLMLACQVNNLAIVCYLLDNYQPTLDAQDLNGFTGNNFLEVVLGDTSYCLHLLLIIALHYAVYSNSPEICGKLLDEGADRNVRDVNKKKPLHLAIYKNYGLCASVLEDLKSKLAMATGDNLNI